MSRRRPKDIGTAFTSAVIHYLNANGFPHAELRNQAGANDKGDITGTPGVAWECKGGHAAENASDAQILAWLVETETERRNAGADIGLLVVKRKAVGDTNAGRWWAVMPLQDVATLAVGASLSYQPVLLATPVRLHLSDAAALLRAAGYGTPPPQEATA